MKPLFRVTLFSLIVFGAITPDIGAQDLYDPSEVSGLKIDFYDTNWDAILDGYMGQDSDERILADVTINGIVFDSVGVRYKGNSSYRSTQVKNPLNIKLNYVKDQDYQGYYTLKLSNGFKDPSFVREVLALEIARKYMPAARAGYANVTINDSFIGLYTNVQSINDVFTEEHYLSENRPFFEGAGDGPSPAGCSYTSWEYMGIDSTNCYPYYYDSKSDPFYGTLINFLDVFNNQPNDMESVYNVDRHLWAMAYDIALVNLDAPISMPHNFYLYYDETERFNYIKWDLNECFGVFQRLSGTQVNLTGMQELDPYVNNNLNTPILYKVWQNSRWKKMYMAHMKTLMEENISNSWYRERAGELQSHISESVQSDPNKFFSYDQSVDNLDNSVGKSVGISELMDARATYLNSTAYFQLTQPEVSGISHLPALLEPNSDVTILATILNADYVVLGYRELLGGRFEKIEMADDGLHNDGIAGDGIWGVTLPMGTILEYYIYAENADAGIFSPARAEYEFHTLTTSGDIVINEFMASNDFTAADQNGEFDDWIELYNNSSSALSLNGYFLSDDAGEPGKWEFPDTIIAAGAYLVVWADNDILQQGMHASFKLSASGEEIVLSDASGVLLDQVSYALQSADISTGRSPNGDGIFGLMTPTFAAENNSITSTDPGKVKIPELSIYPNPATTFLNIAVRGTEKHQVFMYNMFGQLQDQCEFEGTKTLDISMLSPGIYLISVDGLANGKFIKH
ncbi:MAG: T9SS type A sorting domain-containing protein [Bacteroidetes bacterium]|nr:T9SS type A sorting domain-containing protein [Bacteroidota bacterium]